LYSAQDPESDALITGAAALDMYGLRRLAKQATVHVLVPWHNQRRTTGHVLIERTTRMPAQVIRDGLACAPFSRALVDAARHSTDVDEVRAMMAEAVQRRFSFPRRIAEEVRNAPVRHSRLARQVASEIADGVRSPAEGWLRRAFAQFRVPPPRWNVPLHDLASGRVIAVPDALWVDHCVIAEVDSVEYHLSPRDWHRTQRRHAALTALGFAVLHFAPTRIRADPAGVCSEVRATLAANADRQWPRTVTVPGQ
jgi:hypothetical protein